MEGTDDRFLLCMKAMISHFKYLGPLFIYLFLLKGTGAIRPMRLPEELVFTVDEKVRSDISLAKQRYLESVSKY